MLLIIVIQIWLKIGLKPNKERKRREQMIGKYLTMIIVLGLIMDLVNLILSKVVEITNSKGKDKVKAVLENKIHQSFSEMKNLKKLSNQISLISISEAHMANSKKKNLNLYSKKK